MVANCPSKVFHKPFFPTNNSRKGFLRVIKDPSWIFESSWFRTSSVPSCSSAISSSNLQDSAKCDSSYPNSHTINLISLSNRIPIHFCFFRRGSVIRLPNGDSYGHPFDPTRVTQISWHPRFESSIPCSWLSDCMNISLNFEICTGRFCIETF